MFRVRIVAWAAACAIGTLGAGTALAQTSDDLFDAGTLQEIRLSLSSRDLQTLKATYDKNTHYPADLQWRGQRVRNVSVRSRGSGSRNQTKIGLQLNFDRYVAGQKFLGMTSLVLDNLVQDPAMVRERVAMQFFQHMGLTAPRESFCRLYINNVYAGVYGVVEDITPAFLQHALGDTDGYLFEYQYSGPYYGEYLGDGLAPYKELFEARSHELDSDTILYTPLRDLFKEVNAPDDPVWRDRVEALLDLRQFVRYVATETFLAEADGILNLDGMSNFYLYRPHDSTQHRFLPWDTDRTFYLLEASVVANLDTNVLMRRALAYPDVKALYLDTLANCAISAQTDSWLDQEIARSAEVIANSAAADTFKPFTNEEMAAATSVLRTFAIERSGVVLQELARVRAEQDGEPSELRLRVRR